MNEKPMSFSETMDMYSEAMTYADTLVDRPLDEAVGLMMANHGMDIENAAAAMAIALSKAKRQPVGDPRLNAYMDGDDLILVIKHNGKRVRLTPHDVDRICGDAPLVSDEDLQRIMSNPANLLK